MGEIAKHWIDGEWTASDTVSESVNPATGAVLGQWADGGQAEARAAIAAARHAFDASPWSRDRSLRHRALSEMADRFDTHAEELGTLVTRENGKKIAEALLEVEDVTTDIVQKEVFGPVATFEIFDTETDAISRANATEYGLAAGILTNDINISRRVSREIHAGPVWTNTWAAINDGFAEGGFKQSGIGRLRGPLAITEFQEAKTVVHSIPPLQG